MHLKIVLQFQSQGIGSYEVVRCGETSILGRMIW